MERKNYLVKELTSEEKVYLKRIVMTARNKYIQKNYNYINNTNIVMNDELFAEETVLNTVLRKCQDEVDSAIEFEKIISNPKLYNIVKALSLREKEVLFYLYKEQKNIKEVSEIMHLDRKTVRKYRNVAQEKIIKRLINGGF